MGLLKFIKRKINKLNRRNINVINHYDVEYDQEGRIIKLSKKKEKHYKIDYSKLPVHETIDTALTRITSRKNDSSKCKRSSKTTTKLGLAHKK